jgi:carbohydrate-selective porin OprB
MATDLGARNDRAFGAGFHAGFLWCRPVALLCLASFLSSAPCAEPPAPSEVSEVSSGDKALAAITGNPAAENQLPGTGLAGRLIHLPEDSGLRLGGLWLADTNGLLSGGAQPGKWSWNSALIIGANLDAEKLLNWKGASFGVQFLQFNGQDTNGQAGSVQGYNSLPGSKPLNRSELYQLWYRQTLFDDKIVFRIGKMVPTYDFNNVARPVPTQDEALEIPAVTGLLYTPVFVNPTLLGAIGGQRIWGRSTETPAPDGKNVIPASEGPQKASISTFVQFGLNNSETLPVKEYFGLGFTGFGLVPDRPDDSVGIGSAWSWLNPNLFVRSNELMFQGYYQAHLYAGTFFQPAGSYIPNPGVSPKFNGAWALTFRFTFLF